MGAPEAGKSHSQDANAFVHFLRRKHGWAAGIRGVSGDDRDVLALSGKVFSQFGQELGGRRNVRIKISIDKQNPHVFTASNDVLCIS